MIQSIFSHIRPNIEGNKIKNLKKLLEELGASKIFQPVYDEFGADAEKVVTYLIFTYPLDSTFTRSGVDFKIEKEGILELVGLDIDNYEKVLKPSTQSVKSCILFLVDEIKSWQYRKYILLKEASQRLDALALTEPDIKNKNAAKNIHDAATFSVKLSKEADDLYKIILQQSKSPDKIKEAERLSIEDASYEKLLREVSGLN